MWHDTGLRNFKMDIKAFSPSTNFNISYINFFIYILIFCYKDVVFQNIWVVGAKFQNFFHFFFSVFGNTGLHLILRGSVVPQTSPAYSRISETTEFPSPTPIFDEDELQVKEKVGILWK